MLAAGHEVAVLDSLASGSRKNVNPAARFYELDVRDREGMLRTLQDFRPDVVDHHAAQAEVPRSVKEPVYDAEVNLLGGINLLMASLDTGVRKLIFASTGGRFDGERERLPAAADGGPVRW